MQGDRLAIRPSPSPRAPSRALRFAFRVYFYIVRIFSSASLFTRVDPFAAFCFTTQISSLYEKNMFPLTVLLFLETVDSH